MTDKDSVLNSLQSFMDRHFTDGESNVSSWRQSPYCNDLFKIYSAAKECGMDDESLVGFIRTQWNITLQNYPTSERTKQIEEFCLTLSAWDLYDRCSS